MNITRIQLRAKLLFLFLFCFGSLSAETIDGVEYTLDYGSRTAIVCSIDSEAENITIPTTNSYDEQEFTVTEIEQWCFRDKENLKSVALYFPMERIPDCFFANCYNLETVILPESVESIDYQAFYGCEKLSSLDFLPKNVNSIGDEAFAGCTSLTEIVIKKGIQYGNEVFNECSGVTSMTIEAIPDSCNTNFGYYGCDNLRTLRIEDSNEPLSVSLPTDSPIEEAYIGRDLKQDYSYYPCPEFNSFPTQYLRSVTFGNEVTYVPSYIFEGASQLDSVTLGCNIKKIGSYAFYNSSLTSIVIPESVDSLYENAFGQNTGLTSVTLPGSLEYIGAYCFSGSQITTITLPASIETIEMHTFSDCKSLQSITIPQNVTSIGYGAFWNCKTLSQIHIGKNVKSIGDAAFYGCNKLYDVYYDGTISDWCRMEINADTYEEDTSPLQYAKNFYIDNGISYKAVTDLIIPNDVEGIKDYTFAQCKTITSVTIPDNVHKIGTSAFYDCTKLKYIHINSDTISRVAFLGCKADTLVLGTNVKVIEDHAFYNGLNKPKNVIYTGNMSQWLKIEVEDNALTCGNLSIDGELLTKIELEQYSATSIRPYAFCGCTSLKEVYLPYSVKSIGDKAFYGCSNLTEVTAKGTTKIGVGAFANCSKLSKANLTLGSATRSGNSECLNIGAGAFAACPSLEEIILPDNLGTIGSDAFAGTPWYEKNFSDGPVYFGTMLYEYKGKMPEQTVVDIREGTKSIGEYAFENQINLTTVNIPSTVESIGQYAFAYSGINSLKLPSSVTNIGNNAFDGSLLKSIRLPESIDTIPAYMLQDCNALRSINIPGSVNYIEHDAFAGCNSLVDINIEDSERPLKFEYMIWYLYNGQYVPFYPKSIGFKSSLPEHIYIGRDIQSDTLTYLGQEYYFDTRFAFNADSLQTLTIGEFVKEVNIPDIPLQYEWDENNYEYRYSTVLTSIRCLGNTPPSFPLEQDPFNDFIKENVPLYVPVDAVASYKTADVWCGFYNIAGTDFSGIKETAATVLPNQPTYNLKGVAVGNNVESLPAGLYIQGGKKLLKRD